MALSQFRTRLDRGEYTYEEVGCLCGGHTSLLIGERDRYGLPVATRLCRSCGMLWTSPRMTAASLGRFYADDYRPIYVGHAIAPDMFFADQVRHGHEMKAYIGQWVPDLAGATVFDVGCGAGGTLLSFIEAGWRGYGCDLGDSYLDRGRTAGLTLLAGDIDVLRPYAPARLVILSHVPEHLADPLQNLRKIREHLEPDGYLYIELPGVLSIHRSYGSTLRFLQNAHLYHFTLHILTSLLATAGFRLVAGNEDIWALFQKDDAAASPAAPGHADHVLRYLRMLEISHTLYLDRGGLAARRLFRRLRRWLPLGH